MTTAPPRSVSRGWTVLWIILIGSFLLLSLAWPARAARFPASASRTDTFGAPAGVKSVSIDGVSGDVEVTAGASFSAIVSVTANADGEARAREILQQTKISFENRGGALSLATLEPGATLSRDSHRTRVHVSGDGGRRWRVEARYRVTLPAGAMLAVSLVNGGVTTSGLDGVQELVTVNGRIVASGAKRDVTLRTVNGSVEAQLASLPRGAVVVAETVNGGVRLVLPAEAAFGLKASSMNGGIRSTFPLPVSDAASGDEDVARAAADRAKTAADRARATAELGRGKGKGSDANWEREWEEFGREMASFGREMARFSREISRSVSGSLNRSYEGVVKGGGASVKCTTVNGVVLVLAAGTKEEEARSLVPKRAPASAVSRMAPVPPVPPIPPVASVGLRQGSRHAEGSIVEGDVSGDFRATLPTGDVRLGHVSGQVTVRTSSGEVRIASAGKGADLSSSGGDVRIDRVEGGLTVSTLGGDIVVGDVLGETKLRTMGGDVRLRSAKGPLSARTAGGDVRLLRVAGPIRAETAGGEVYCEVVSKDAGAVELSTGGGDVTLVLPANFRGDVDVVVRSGDGDGDDVISEFPEIVVRSHRGPGQGVVRAEGKLNGGGAKVSISASSGRVSLLKGPPA